MIPKLDLVARIKIDSVDWFIPISNDVCISKGSYDISTPYGNTMFFIADINKDNILDKGFRFDEDIYIGAVDDVSSIRIQRAFSLFAKNVMNNTDESKTPFCY